MNVGPGDTDWALFEDDDAENDEPEVDGDEWEDDGRDADDVAWDNEHSPGSDHRDY